MAKRAPSPETSDVLLRDVTSSDLPIFFDQQLDADANYMAAFTAKDPTDRDAFMTHWTKILGDETITIKTILFDGQVAGSVLSYKDEDVCIISKQTMMKCTQRVSVFKRAA